jgi:hypothetical protein
MANKQTAVEWLTKRCNDSLDKEPNEPTQQEIGYSKALVHFIILLKEAKQMEKEQIIDAYSYGFWRGNNDDDFEPEEYYEDPYCNPDNKYYGK